MNSRYAVIIVISEPHVDGIIIWAYIYCGFWDHEIIFVTKTLYVEQKSAAHLRRQTSVMKFQLSCTLF